MSCTVPPSLRFEGCVVEGDQPPGFVVRSAEGTHIWRVLWVGNGGREEGGEQNMLRTVRFSLASHEKEKNKTKHHLSTTPYHENGVSTRVRGGGFEKVGIRVRVMEGGKLRVA